MRLLDRYSVREWWDPIVLRSMIDQRRAIIRPLNRTYRMAGEGEEEGVDDLIRCHQRDGDIQDQPVGPIETRHTQVRGEK